MTPLILPRPGAFSDAECDALIRLAGGSAMAPGPVWQGTGYGIDRTMRDVASSLHPRGAETEWIYERLDRLFAEAGAHFGIAAGPLREPVQLLRYATGGHFAVWHTDTGRDGGVERSLSASVELSGLGDHDGGALEVAPGTVGQPRTLPRGGAMLFPSRALHRVTPVTRGERWALVAWAGGPG